MKQVIVVAGPTASGKSEFACELAEMLQGEIISGDSIQVYRGFNIGSGKVTAQEMHGIPHHLIDILDGKQQYTVSDFQKQARKLIEEINMPIIAGGTGLYLKACLYDYAFEAETDNRTDPALKAKDTAALYELLMEKDPVQAQKIHPHNRRRILRSLMILEHSGIPQSSQIARQSHQMLYDAWICGCTMPREVLYERIDARVAGMFEAGLEQEVRDLLNKGYTFRDPAMKGIGYREWEPYFAGECDVETVKETIQKNSRHYARRQYTWLNHQLPVHWFDVREESERNRMKQEILNWRRQ